MIRISDGNYPDSEPDNVESAQIFETGGEESFEEDEDFSLFYFGRDKSTKWYKTLIRFRLNVKRKYC